MQSNCTWQTESRTAWIDRHAQPHDAWHTSLWANSPVSRGRLSEAQWLWWWTSQSDREIRRCRGQSNPPAEGGAGGWVSCDWWRAKLLLVVAVSSWWNLQWSFQVTGAERLQRNGELLPGGVQIVLHHLPTNHWHEPHHDKNTISILVTTLCVCLCTSVRWTSCHFPSSAFLKNSKNGSDFPNVSWRRRTQCDAILTHSLCAWGHFVHRGVSSKTKTLGLSKIHRTSGLTFLSRFFASNSNTMALLSLISSAVI